MKTSKPIKNNKSFDNERLLKYKEIFDGLSSETIGEIYNMSKHIDFNNKPIILKIKILVQSILLALEVECIFLIT